jgi:protein gp37
MTKIEWTDKTVNPIHFLSIVDGKKQNGGHICIKRSPACMNCYAEDANLNGYKFWASRLEYHANEIIETLPDFLKLGNQKATVFINSRLFLSAYSKSIFEQFLKKVREIPLTTVIVVAEHHTDEKYFSKILEEIPNLRLLVLDESYLFQLANSRTEKRVFMCSMTDLFGHWVPDSWLAKIFAIAAIAQNTTFQFLTKREDRLAEWFKSNPQEEIQKEIKLLLIDRRLNRNQQHAQQQANLLTWPIPNIELGVTAENQHYADLRIPKLLECEAAVHWVSFEPLLGEITDLPYSIDWAVIGGESGKNSRQTQINQIANLVNLCENQDIRVFVKQLGKNVIDKYGRQVKIRSTHGDKEIPEELFIRELPSHQTT